MTDTITPAAVATAASTINASSSKTTDSKNSGLTSDFETFLKMLTAQARYQDPLEPIDSTEYAAQLAQFSMVEQQVKTNDTLAALFEQMGTSSMASLAQWVGMEARANTPVYFDGQPVTVAPGIAPTADKAFLVVKDANGQQVQRSEIELTGDLVQWAGVDDTGSPFENGVYAFSVENFKDGIGIASGGTDVYRRIDEAQAKESGVVLVLEGGQTINANDVKSLRQGA